MLPIGEGHTIEALDIAGQKIPVVDINRVPDFVLHQINPNLYISSVGPYDRQTGPYHLLKTTLSPTEYANRPIVWGDSMGHRSVLALATNGQDAGIFQASLAPSIVGNTPWGVAGTATEQFKRFITDELGPDSSILITGMAGLNPEHREECIGALTDGLNSHVLIALQPPMGEDRYKTFPAYRGCVFIPEELRRTGGYGVAVFSDDFKLSKPVYPIPSIFE